MKRELVANFVLILSFIFLFACRGPDAVCQWHRQQISETFDCPYAKRVYCVTQCPYTEPELSFIEDACGLKAYLSITSGCFFTRCFKHGTEVTYSTGGMTRTDRAIVFRGNQMLQLSSRATEEISQALQRGQDVVLATQDLQMTIPAKGFAEVYSEKGRNVERWLPRSNFSFPFEDTINGFMGKT